MEAVVFLGRFHVLALHLPIGMLLAAVAVDWVARRPNRRALAAASPFLWGATAISAVATAALGFMHFAEGGFTGPSASAHRVYGTLVAVGCLAVWWLSTIRPTLHRKHNVVTGIVLLGLVTLTGHHGGNLTHGSQYLLEYAPQPIRTLAGFDARRPPVTALAAADPWHDIVQPILGARCSSCHNDDKRSGGLSLVGYEAMLAGGDTGSVVVPGNFDFSELYRRISLSAEDDAFMPAEGKMPLTADQAEIVRWWIDAGAPVDTTLGELSPPAELDSILRAEVGLDEAADEVPPRMANTEPAVVKLLFAGGFLVRQVSQADPRLVVGVYSVGADLDRSQLAALESAAGHVVSLDLHDAGLEDDALERFDAFTLLETLRISKNSITDAGVRTLAGLSKLERLNLYGNADVGDASVETLAAMPSLSTVYLWRTGVTSAGAERLAAKRPGLEVDLGAQPFPTVGASESTSVD